MKTTFKSAIAILSLIGAAASSVAMAGPADAQHPLARDQVRAEAIRARAAGELDFNETNYPSTPNVAPSNVTRAQVRAEVLHARANGELDMDDTDYPYAAKEAPSHLTRAEVKADAIKARANGELDWTDATYPDAAEHISQVSATTKSGRVNASR